MVTLVMLLIVKCLEICYITSATIGNIDTNIREALIKLESCILIFRIELFLNEGHY